MARELGGDFRLKEPEGIFVGYVQMGQGDAGVQVGGFLIAMDVDGVAFVGEVPGLAVDGGGGQAGRFQPGVGNV